MKLNRYVDRIVWHCTGGPRHQKVETILDYWRRVLGWKTPGYHVLIDQYGEPHELVDINKISNGVGGFNKSLLNIAYIGGAITYLEGSPVNAKGNVGDTRTPEQIQTMYKYTRMFNELAPRAVILGHRDFSPDKNRNGIIEPREWNKACPGFSTREDLDKHKFESVWGRILIEPRVNAKLRSGWSTDFGSRAIIPARTPLKYLGEIRNSDDGFKWVYCSSLSGINLTGWIRGDLMVGTP